MRHDIAHLAHIELLTPEPDAISLTRRRTQRNGIHQEVPKRLRKPMRNAGTKQRST